MFLLKNKYKINKVKIIDGAMDSNLIVNFFMFLIKKSKYS